MKNKINSSDEGTVPPTNSSDESEDAASLLDHDDTCSAEELYMLFQAKWRIADESAVSMRKDYVLELAADRNFTRVAAGLSSGAVHIFDINSAGTTLATLTEIPPPSACTDTPASICGVRFLDETPHNLLVGSGGNGVLRLFDLRIQKQVACFEENIEMTQGSGNSGGAKSARKPINCFDSNSNGRIVCTGTDQSQGNVYLLFYDVRERQQLGGYFESHGDDITAIQFHPTNPDLMCSGSTDGLINVYDLKETSEDDALLTTINTESSVHKLRWHKNVYEQDLISSITHTNDFHIYLAECDVVAKFERSQITAAARLRNEANCNVIDAHSLESDEIFLLTGTNHNKGEIMRTVLFKNNLLPMSDFNDNKQIVRASIFDKKSGNLLTGGESGFITLWNTEIPTTNGQPAALASSSSELKHKNKKSIRKTPY